MLPSLKSVILILMSFVCYMVGMVFVVPRVMGMVEVEILTYISHTVVEAVFKLF